MAVLKFQEPTSPEVLPRQFELTFSGDELVAVTEWASRYAPSPNASINIDCCFLPGGRRRWVVREANVIGWLDFTDDSQPVRGAVTLPLHLLRSAHMADPLGEGISAGFDLEAGKISVGAGDVVVHTDLPTMPSAVVPPLPTSARSASIAAVDVAAAASLLRSCPFDPTHEALSPDGDSIPWPYVTLSSNGESLRLGRDWSEFGHEKVETAAPAWGEGMVEAEFYGNVVLRELYLADEMQGQSVTFALYSDEPAIMVVSAGNWGMVTTLGTDVVLRFREEIETALAAADVAYEEDPHLGWNPCVVAAVRDRRVEARLVRAPQLHQSHVRVSTSVIGGVSWNHDLANEINLWNDKWFDTKLALVNDELVVMSDVPVTSIHRLPTVFNDVVEKSLIVYDVVGVFL